jgi:hypothetical protein
MTLEEAIVAYSRRHVSPSNDWYKWRRINRRFLPEGIRLVDQDNEYAQNVSLKQQLCALYCAGNDEAKIAATEYYIKVWGGVRRNRPQRIRRYALDQPNVLIANGRLRIASWSKALCIRDPGRYAIYDARVAVSLNVLQIIYRVEKPSLFPPLLGQNRLINKGSNILACYARENRWVEHLENEFYEAYNALIANVANELRVDLCTIEMLLFANAPVLLSNAFTVEQLA